MIVTIPCYPSVTAFVNDQNRIKKLRGDNMKSQKEMGHFIGWKFGVPVKVSSCHYSVPYTEQVLLIRETDFNFTVQFMFFIKEYDKRYYYYELIPHKAGGLGPRYPICSNPNYTAYCNGGGVIQELDCLKTSSLKPYSVATLNIDGKTIELSAEITAELKKKLGGCYE